MAFKKKEYLEALRTRAKQSKVYRPYQLHGLEIAEMLGDEAHKSLYIKLAKEYDPQMLRGLARTVVEKRDVKNRGAYFMAIFAAEHPRKTLAATKVGPPNKRKTNGRKNIPAR